MHLYVYIYIYIVYIYICSYVDMQLDMQACRSRPAAPPTATWWSRPFM